VFLFHRAIAGLCLLAVLHGCSPPQPGSNASLRYRAAGESPEVVAVYEAWFGHPRHLSVGYSSHDPAVIKRQIRQAKAMGVSAFVVDWYGDREPFIDESYGLMQKMSAKEKFHVAMMYDESDEVTGATDEAIADLTMFRDTYFSSQSPGRGAYLTYEGRPVIFIFPKGGHTDWSRVHAFVSTWNPPPFLIYENLPGHDADEFDGFYAWVNPGDKGWDANGNNWGEQYLATFYQTMRDKYPNKVIVGGAWASFNDSKASWGLNRHISARCGQTFTDTFNYWRRDFPSDQPIPFMMVETWNDYEEGTAIEPGIPKCAASNAPDTPATSERPPRAPQTKGVDSMPP
jgi:hypothetical protein